MWTKTTYGILCDLGEEETADRAEGEVAEVSVQLYGDPRSSTPGNRFTPKSQIKKKEKI